MQAVHDQLDRAAEERLGLEEHVLVLEDKFKWLEGNLTLFMSACGALPTPADYPLSNHPTGICHF